MCDKGKGRRPFVDLGANSDYIVLLSCVAIQVQQPDGTSTRLFDSKFQTIRRHSNGFGIAAQALRMCNQVVTRLSHDSDCCRMSPRVYIPIISRKKQVTQGRCRTCGRVYTTWADEEMRQRQDDEPLRLATLRCIVTDVRANVSLKISECWPGRVRESAENLLKRST